MTDQRNPYRDSLAACCRRREALVRELERADTDIRARAVLVIPCFTGLSRWQRWKVRRAWKTIREHAQWGDERCGSEMGDPPCPKGSEPCGYVEPDKEADIAARKRHDPWEGDLVCGFPTTEPTLFGDPVFSQPQPPPSKVEK